MTLSTQMFITTVFFLGFLSGSYGATTFMVTNKCSYTVWPAILSAAGTWQLPTTGFVLQPGDSNTVHVPPAWSGRLWGRTLCSYKITGNFSCVTGDCGSSTIECGGGIAATPVTVAEFTLNSTDGLDYFDVSLVDGFNLPVRAERRGGTGAGNCRATSCGRNLNKKCPMELKVIKEGEGVVACKSSCEACNPTLFPQFAMSQCPDAYYDRGFFTCASADYTITFCPDSSERKFSAHVSHLYALLLLIPVVSVSLILNCVCWYRSRNRDCGIKIFSFLQARAETDARNQQTVNNVEMANVAGGYLDSVCN